MLVVDLPGVPLLLELAQLLDDAVGRFDRVRAGIGLVDVDGMAGDLDLEPHHADLRDGERAARRFGDQRRLGAIAALQAGQRTVARALLLDHRLLIDIGRRRVAQRAQSAQRKHVQDQPGLHVARAATVHPAILHIGIVGIARPHLVRPFRHDVDMSVQDQRAALGIGRPPGADHVPGIVVILAVRRVTRQVLQIVDLDLPAIDAEPVLLEEAGHHVLRRRLLEPRRWNAHEIDQHLGLIVERLVDGIHDLGFYGGIEHGLLPTNALAETSKKKHRLARIRTEYRPIGNRAQCSRASRVPRKEKTRAHEESPRMPPLLHRRPILMSLMRFMTPALHVHCGALPCIAGRCGARQMAVGRRSDRTGGHCTILAAPGRTPNYGRYKRPMPMAPASTASLPAPVTAAG